ncbi:MAG: DUF2341 domain-containing protein [Methanocellales archaeon]|nr:DUF2341 domain-containing protein [Methanocellales archaeon]
MHIKRIMHIFCIITLISAIIASSAMPALATTQVTATKSADNNYAAHQLNFSIDTDTIGQLMISQDSDWYNPSWNYRKLITIDHTKVDNVAAPSTTYANFPVLINISSDSGLASKAQSDGDDILFTSSDGTTKLNHEIELYNSSTGELVAWVNVTLTKDSSDATNDTLYMYYGNSGASSQQNAAAVWNPNYKGVWHLDETGNGTSGEYKDSTSSANNGTLVGLQALKASYSMTGSSNTYLYEDLTNVADYTIMSGDFLEYDVYWTSATDFIAFDFTCCDGVSSCCDGTSSLRDSGAVDQNGLSAHVGADLSTYALNKWYHRRIDIPAGLVGKTINHYDVACEYDGSATKTAYVDNIRICNGAFVSKKIYTGGDTITHSTHLTTAGCTLPSFGNALNLTPSSTAGKVSTSLWADGTRYVDFPAYATNAQSNWTVEAWINPVVLLQAGYAVYNGNDAGGYGLGINNAADAFGSKLGALFGFVTYIDSGYTFSSANTWYHVAMVRSSEGTTSFYVNGSVQSGTSSSNPNVLQNKLTFGCELDSSNNPYRYFSGYIDEVRISNTARSANWIKTEHNNQDAPSTFYTLGDEETPSSGVTSPSLVFVDLTPANDSSQAADFAEINISINEENLNEFKFNWNGTNYTFYDDSLVLGMNFNNNSVIGENATKAVDISRYGNNGTAYNGAHPVTGGKFGGAFEFDGCNDHVRVPDSTSLDISPNITIEMWIKPDILADKVLIHKYHAYAMEFWNDGSFGGIIYKPGGGTITVGSGENKTNTGAWSHLAFTYDKTAGKMRLYLNGTDAGSKSYSGNIRTSNIDLLMGCDDSLAYFFDGAIDEVRIYNRALSPEEIRMHYQSEFQKYTATQWYFYDNVTNLPEKTHTYYGWANDTAGNDGQTETRTLTIEIETDTTPPAITIDVPAESAPAYRRGGEQFYVNFTYTENDPKNYTVRVYNSTATINTTTLNYPVGGADQIANVSFYLNSSAADGSYNVSVNMYDNVSNYAISYQNNSVVKDTTNPAISIAYPTNGQVFSTDTITVNGTASDNIALSKVEVKLGSGSWQTASGTTSWSQSITLVNGSNIIYARATDTSYNTQEISITVTYNPPGPQRLLGDVNNDGVVNVLDATLVTNRAADPNYPLDDEWAADVNSDGIINVLDATKVKNRAADPNYPW